MLRIGLSAFALAWILSLWHKTDRLRERFGVYHVYDGAGEPVDRDDGGGIGGWLNCPLCAVVLALPVAAWLKSDALAGLGIGILLTRWFESLRPKARWWE